MTVKDGIHKGKSVKIFYAFYNIVKKLYTFKSM